LIQDRAAKKFCFTVAILGEIERLKLGTVAPERRLIVAGTTRMEKYLHTPGRA